jgi:hypothetical protein
LDFERDSQQVSCVLIYAEPDPKAPNRYRAVVAEDTGFEGIACVDDTARAALLALQSHELTGSSTALTMARRWLSFVEYMQYPDGTFANFIRNTSGIRNATGPTSHRGGAWWTLRALWALTRAYRVTRDVKYLERYEACRVEPGADGKLRAVQALTELELYRISPTAALRRSILGHCDVIQASAPEGYFWDQPGTPLIHLWGYHQVHAMAEAARLLDEPVLLRDCRRTISALVVPCVRAKMWYSYPDRRKDGVCAYCVTPLVQGLAAMHRATGAKRYAQLGLRAAEWFYGRNDAGVVMYDGSGRCRDGITHGVASGNYGAESSIEAGLTELERRSLMSE